MQVETLTLGELQTNTYLVWSEDAPGCVVIDPGYEPETILRAVRRCGKKLEAIFLTHGHFDHVGAVREIVKQTGCALWMREADWSIRKDAVNLWLYPLAGCDFCEVSFYEEGEELSLAGTRFWVLETPGHTWGSVCIGAENALFTGDTLFAGGCGRTDLPGGDWNTIVKSLQRLGQLEGDYTVYPGHGPATMLAAERRDNPYMKGTL